MNKHRAPQPGDYWIVTTSLSQYVVRLTRVADHDSDFAWVGVRQVPRTSQHAPYEDVWHDHLGIVAVGSGPFKVLTELVRPGFQVV